MADNEQNESTSSPAGTQIASGSAASNVEWFSPVGRIAMPLLIVFALSFPQLLGARCFVPLTGIPAWLLGMPSTFLASPLADWLFSYGTTINIVTYSLLLILLSIINIYGLASVWFLLAKLLRRGRGRLRFFRLIVLNRR